MSLTVLTVVCLAGLVPLAVTAGQDRKGDAIKRVAQPFAPGEVRLLPGPFFDAQERDRTFLNKLDPDRLLHRFRLGAGLQPKAPIYGGWEKDTISGHSLGHYLSACAHMIAATGDEGLKAKVDHILAELKVCQDARKDGYVGGIPDPDRLWNEIRRGEIRSKGFDLNGIWVPWYTQHKLFSGLLDCYEILGKKEALTIADRLGDWAVEVTSSLTPEKWQQMMACEFGGMNEAMANLYAATGKRAHFELARNFHHDAFVGPLEKGEPRIQGLHGNTQIPKVLGSARLYELSGEAKDERASRFFWEQVVRDHTYAIGGHGMNEYFGPPDQLNDRLNSSTAETCNTYNMLKLTRMLLSWRPTVEQGDFYERAMLNHILASQDPRSGGMIYFAPLQPGTFKTYSDVEDSFWCCTGTGMENHAKYGEAIYFDLGETLLVNLFVPSELDWKAKGLKVKLETRYPVDGHVRLAFSGTGKAAGLKIRKPAWAEGDFALKLNGGAVHTMADSDGFLPLLRELKGGDVVEFTVPLKLRTEPMPDNPDRVALLWGPAVLSGDLGATSNDFAPNQIPVLITGDRDPANWLKRTSDDRIEFVCFTARPGPVTLRPYYDLHHRRAITYFDFFTEAQWTEREENYRRELTKSAALEARSTDHLRIGEMQPERDHNLQGENTRAGDFMNRKWRHATGGGWFSFEMKVDPEEEHELLLTFWGGDAGGREFQVMIDGQVLKEIALTGQHPGTFFDEVLKVPKEWTAGRTKVTVKLQAKPGMTAGGLFDARMMKK